MTSLPVQRRQLARRQLTHGFLSVYAALHRRNREGSHVLGALLTIVSLLVDDVTPEQAEGATANQPQRPPTEARNIDATGSTREVGTVERSLPSDTDPDNRRD